MTLADAVSIVEDALARAPSDGWSDPDFGEALRVLLAAAKADTDTTD